MDKILSALYIATDGCPSEAFYSPLLAGRIYGFNHPIRVGKDQIARRKLNGAFLIGPIRKHSDQRATGFKPDNGAVPPYHQGRIVACVDVPERAERLRAVLHVLYLIFNEGYTSSAGPHLQRSELSREAIRLTRAVHALLPLDWEVAGLLALMLLTDARRAARTGPGGELIPLTKQDRTLWDRAEISEGIALITAALSNGSIGSYPLQAAIAAVHDESARAEDTNWPPILALYELLKRISSNPMVKLNHAIAVAMVRGPSKGLELLRALDSDARLAGHHRLHAVRAHLLEMAGDYQAAVTHYRIAASRTTTTPEQNYLITHAARLSESSTSPDRMAARTDQ